MIFCMMMILIGLNDSSGETIFRENGTIFLKVYGGLATASSYFDVDENKIISLKDESYKFDTLHCVNDYTLELTKKIIDFSCEYSLSNELIVYGKLPISFNSLDEVYQYDYCAHTKYEKAKYSLTHVEYLGIGAKYELFNRKSYGFLVLEGRIPPGFKNGVTDTSENVFLSDGAFELRTGLGFGLNSEKFILESYLGYNYRDEEFADELVIKTEAGIKTVQDTKLSVTGEYVTSIKSYKNAIPLIINRPVIQEDYLSIGFEFGILFSSTFYFDFSYNLRLYGKNSWILGTFNVGAGYLINSHEE